MTRPDSRESRRDIAIQAINDIIEPEVMRTVSVEGVLELSEDVMEAAVRVVIDAVKERYCDTSQGIVCSDFRKAADFIEETFYVTPR